MALYPAHAITGEILWQHADIALRTAKEKFETHLFYSNKIDSYDPTRLILLGELRAAIEEGQLLLHYQPKIDLSSGSIIGVEALVRWQHPTRGLIFPDTFIPLAERSGLINPLTDRRRDERSRARRQVLAGGPVARHVGQLVRPKPP